MGGTRRRRPTSDLFTGPTGKRLTDLTAALVPRRIATDAGVPFSAHVARHTAATTLARDGVDIVLVAEVLGHASLGPTRCHSRPSEADHASALERLVVEALPPNPPAIAVDGACSDLRVPARAISGHPQLPWHDV